MAATPSALSLVKIDRFREKNRADVLVIETGARIPRVPIMASMAGTNVGAINTPEPTQGDEPYSPFETKDRDIYGFMGYVGNVPVILGFLYPEVCQLFFEDLKRSFNRHGSDVYTTIDGDGNVEVFHPSGTFIRIATDPAHEDLTGDDIDGKWKIEKNTETAVHVRVVVKNAGDQVADLHITPDGDVTLEHDGDLEVKTGGNAVIDVEGSITSSASSWTHTGPMTVNGNVQINGDAGVSQTLTATTDVIGGSKSLKTHVHPGVTAGAAMTGPPQS